MSLVLTMVIGAIAGGVVGLLIGLVRGGTSPASLASESERVRMLLDENEQIRKHYRALGFTLMEFVSENEDIKLNDEDLVAHAKKQLKPFYERELGGSR